MDGWLSTFELPSREGELYLRDVLVLVLVGSGRQGAAEGGLPLTGEGLLQLLRLAVNARRQTEVVLGHLLLLLLLNPLPRPLSLGSPSPATALESAQCVLRGDGVDVHAAALPHARLQQSGDAEVQIGAAQRLVAVGGVDLHGALRDVQQRHVQRAAAKVVHQNVVHVGLLVKLVGHSGGRGLLDHSHHLQSRSLVALTSGATLIGVELCGHRHHGLVHLIVPQILRSDPQQKLQDLSSYIFRRNYCLSPVEVDLEANLAEV